MRTTVTLDQDVYEAAAHLSRFSGERLGKVLSGLARRGLQPQSPPRRRKTQRFPAFEVPPGTPAISLAEVRQFLEREGVI